MHLLLYSINYAPELTGVGKYSGEMAEWLATRNIAVTVVTAAPYYPAWRVEPPYDAGRYRRETLLGVDVIRCPLFVPRRVTALTRVLHLTSFALCSLPVLLWLAVRHRPSVILVIEPPLFAAPAAWLAARISGATAWLHVQDFEVDAAFDLGFLRTGVLRRIAAGLESWLMRRFDRVSTISARMLHRLATKKVATERTALFPNWVELGQIRPLASPPRLRTNHFDPEQIVVLYSGNMGKKQGLETVIETAKLLRQSGDEHVHFLLCGNGVAREELEASALGAKNVTFWPLVPLVQLNELLNVADIHVLPQRADAADLVFPSKLTNMLASGRPVVATAHAGTQIATMLEGCGVVVPPGNAASLAAALRALGNDAQRRRALGEAARRVAERQWDKDAVLTAAFKDYLEPPQPAGVEVEALL